MFWLKKIANRSKRYGELQPKQLKLKPVGMSAFQAFLKKSFENLPFTKENAKQKKQAASNHMVKSCLLDSTTTLSSKVCKLFYFFMEVGNRPPFSL